MTLNVAVQMDAIEHISIAGDTTFALMLEAASRGHRVHYYRPEYMSLRDGKVVAKIAPVQVRDIAGDHFTLGESASVDLSTMDVVLLRQDPPFDLAYITSTHLLERLPQSTLVVNDPAEVRNAPEKLFVLDFPQLMPATLVTRDRTEIEAFRRQHGEVIMKPLHGHGGASVFKIAETDANFGSLYDLFASILREQWIVQAFIKNIVHGDKRIVLIDGEPLGAVNRVPAANDIRSNMVRGGAAAATQFTDREHEICRTIGPELKTRGLLLVGIDVIDGYLTEINVTSPTGIRAIKRVGGPDLAVAYWNAVEAKASARKSGPCAERLVLTAVLERVASHRRRRGTRRRFFVKDVFDREAILDKLAAAHASARETAVDHFEVVSIFRDALGDARAQIRRDLEDGGDGLRCARHLSQVEDECVRTLLEYVVRDLHPAPESEQRRLVIAAVGGYGRGTLAPCSDVDLLFLLPTKDDAWALKVTEAMLYVLWDLRQKVGHATRSIEDCLHYAREDMTIRTSLLESRYILGDRELFDTLRMRFEQEVVSSNPAEFVAAKLAERDQRVSKAGKSRFLVEPNVKDGKGGLRDLNTLFWIAKYVYRVRNASELVQAGLFSRKEYRLFCRCEEFLWRVRCHLHFLTGRAEERLSFDLQRVLAERLGYVGRAGLHGVERFMKHYFLIAKEVGDLTAIVCAALEERQTKPSPMLDRFFGRIWRRKQVLSNPDFVLENARITAADPAVFARDPVNLIRLFSTADETGLAIHPDAMRLVTLNLTRIDAHLRNDPGANRLFLSILTSRNSPAVVLRLMNAAGVLGRFIPEFGRIVSLMQFNMYHSYTVDEHLIRSIAILADIESGRSAIEHPLAQELLPALRDRTVLIVALFLHDIAKGRMEDHSLAGMAVARKLCPRLRLSPDQTEEVVWLIEQHLVMSDTAQRRDLSDRRTIETFAEIVGNTDRLNMLFILTVCDIRAVGPGIWNGWKAELLKTLYWETEHLLGGDLSTIARDRRVAAAREELRKALPTWSQHDFDAYAARHQGPYWLKVDLPHKVRHASILNMSEVESPGPIVDWTTDESRGITELTVIAPDHPRLLSIIAGSCAATAADIVDAQIFTTTDGLALDMIHVTRALSTDEDELRRAGRIAIAIERALTGEIRLADVVAARRKSEAAPSEIFDVEPECNIDNTLSNRYTVIEIAGLDRRGLLFNMTAILSQLELNIGSAHIATFGERASDTFYVTDLTGAKVVDPARKAAISDAVLQIFSGNPTRQLQRLGL